MISSKRIRVMPKPLYHESIWKTDNTSAGSSTDHQVSLPFVATGTYDCIVEWGDGSQDYITTWNQAETTHTYTSIGTYTIKIKGKCEGFQFNNTLDKLKLLTIERWGKDFSLGNVNSNFYGCTNLQVNADDYLDTSIMTDFYRLFYDCTTLNGDLNFSDTSNVTNMTYSLRGCTNFNGSISSWNTSNVTVMVGMFYECTSFNKNVLHFNTSNVTDMYSMFYSCSSFNQDISNFNMEGVTNVFNMLSGATSWSTENYDAFLIEIATNQNVVDSLTFHCSSTYSLGGSAEAARTDLIATDLWTINDLGGV